MDSGAERSSSLDDNGTVGARSLIAFDKLLPSVPENWEVGPLEIPRPSGAAFYLKHLPCGFVWSTPYEKLSENVVCFNCGEK